MTSNVDIASSVKKYLAVCYMYKGVDSNSALLRVATDCTKGAVV